MTNRMRFGIFLAPFHAAGTNPTLALQRDLERLLHGRTAIVIAHRLATVEAADRILVLRRGRLVEEGNHRELRAAGGLYAQLAELQEKGLATL